jgi:hypothetical protein
VAECVHLPVIEPQTATFPGGASLEAVDLIEAAQPALAPLQPIFNIIDAVTGVLEVLQAIPDALGPPPDPTGLIEKLPALAEKVGRLAGLVPQLSVPLMAVNLIDAVIRELERARSQLLGLVEALARAAAAGQRATELGDPNLTRLVECAEEDVDTAAGNILSGLAAVGGVLGILRPLVAAIGGPQLPDLSSLDGDDLGQLVATFDELLAVLRAARGAIPLPPP